jgi:hypothetical protein
MIGKVSVVILEKVKSIQAIFVGEFTGIDLVSGSVFAAEYFLRLWVCTR